MFRNMFWDGRIYKRRRKKRANASAKLKKPPHCDPRRYKRYKYLGKRVPDVGGCGLDSPSEFRGIMKAILADYRSGRIDCRKAKGRLLLLYRLTFVKKNPKVRKISRKVRMQLRREIKHAMSEVRCR